MSGGVLVKDERRGGFYAWGMEQKVIGALAHYQEFWQAIGVTPPVVIGLVLTGVKGWKALRGPEYSMEVDEGGFDRDVVNPQELVMSDLATPADVVLRPLFDYVWTGAGWAGSPNYHDGRWVKPR